MTFPWEKRSAWVFTSPNLSCGKEWVIERFFGLEPGDSLTLSFFFLFVRILANLKMVGLSLPFCEYFWPKVQEAFPQIPTNVSAHEFFQASNEVKPGFIRVEADEVTCGLSSVFFLTLT
jgi:hypothetical protein